MIILHSCTVGLDLPKATRQTMNPSIPSAMREISPDPKIHSDDITSYGLANSTVSASTMTYDDIFPGLPESTTGNRVDGTIGKWNNKLRVGSRNVTQVNPIALNY